MPTAWSVPTTQCTDFEESIARVLGRLRVKLTVLGAERRQRGRARYWILKREFTPGEVIEL
jgi:hypothetical protein